MAAKGPAKIVRKCLTMLCLHASISQLLSSLSHLGLSYLYPGSLVTENLSFYKLINLRSRSQKSYKSTLISDFLCPLSALIEDQSQTYQVFGKNCLKLEEFKQGDPNQGREGMIAG